MNKILFLFLSILSVSAVAAPSLGSKNFAYGVVTLEAGVQLCQLDKGRAQQEISSGTKEYLKNKIGTEQELATLKKQAREEIAGWIEKKGEPWFCGKIGEIKKKWGQK